MTLSYGELDRRARSIAVSLERVASRGDRALLLFPAGLEFLAAFFGCLYAGVVAVPASPPRPGRGFSRLEGILEDSGAALVVAETRAGAGVVPASPHGRLASLPWVATDDVDVGLADGWPGLSLGRENLAYLQYTSGSTSTPRGVMVSHGNLLYNCACMREAYELSPETVSITWLPHFHDMGLVEGLIQPLHTGYPAVVMPPAQFVAKPLRWLQAITRFRATHSGAPNFAYDLCVRGVRPEERAGLDLSCWTGAYCGAEPVRRATLDRFAEYFAPCGFARQAFNPGYGLAEATLMVTSGGKSEAPVFREAKARTLVGCGRARRETQLAIVDPETRTRRPEGAEGEIWVSGPTLAHGYWNRPDETRDTFDARTADTNEGPFLRTGDLGILDRGELFITGRLKDLIVVHGANFYPQDLEWVVAEAHEALRPGFGAAFSIDVDDAERLVVAQEIERRYRRAAPSQLEEIAGAVRQAVAAAFDLEVYAVQLLKVGGIPRTSSGKVRRHACRADYLAGRSEALWESRLDGHAPGSEGPRALRRESLLAMKPRERGLALEEHLCRQVARGLRIPWRRVDPRRGLGSYGLESLKGRELIAELEDSLELKLSSSTLFNYPSIAELSAHLLRLMQIDAAGAAKTAGKDDDGVPHD